MIWRVLVWLLLIISPAYAQTTYNNNIDMRTGQVITPASVSPPTVTAQQLLIPSPVTLGQNVGNIGGTNTPTSWAVTSCSGCTGYFATVGNTDQIAVAAAGVTALNGSADLVTLSPVVVQASNAGGSGQATDTIKVYATPVITANQAFGIPFPPVNSTVGTLATTRGTSTITGWSVLSCIACANFFTIDGTGKMTLTSTGISGVQNNANYHPVVQATNPGGVASATVTVNVQGAPSAPQVTSAVAGISTPAASSEPILTLTTANTTASTVFTVSSCTPACTGWFQFPNQNLPTMTVSATGSANLQGTAFIVGPFSVTVTATNTTSGGSASGSAIVTVNGYADGFKNRPTGVAAQNPTLLDGYVARPPWKVAGVDYGVGPPASQVFKDWRTYTNACVSVDTANGSVTTTANNCTISGVDFTAGNGAQVVVGNSNVTITNSKFSMTNNSPQGSYMIDDTGGSNLTVTYCSFIGTVGNNAGATDSVVNTDSNGLTFLYNYLSLYPQHVMNMGQPSGATSFLNYRYNYIANGGQIPQAHWNGLQWGDGRQAGPVVVSFNTVFQTPQISGGNEAFQFYNNVGNGPISNISLVGNVIIPRGGNLGDTINDAIVGGGAGDQGVNIAQANYFDPTVILVKAFSGMDNWTLTGNINMVTGGSCVWDQVPGDPPCGTGSAPPPPPPPPPAQVAIDGINYPNPLLTNNGTGVSTTATWEGTRRAELISLLAENRFGETLPTPTGGNEVIAVTSTTTATNSLGTPIKLKTITITITGPFGSHAMHVNMFIPTNVIDPSPLILFIDHKDQFTSANVNQSITYDLANITSGTTAANDYSVAQLNAAGVSFAYFKATDVSENSESTFRNAMINIFFDPAQPLPANAERFIGALAWGVMRAMDYLVTDTDINTSKIAVIGNSRGGVAAAWAGAQDTRIAMTFPNLGIAMARYDNGQFPFNQGNAILSNCTNHASFYIPAYCNYGGHESTMPTDDHELVALIAPRKVSVASANQDAFGFAQQRFDAFVGAQPVYNLYNLGNTGFTSNGSSWPITLDHDFGNGTMNFHDRSTGGGIHGLLNEDWLFYVAFIGH